MTSLFTKIINGEIPGRFVWKDDRCVAFLTIAPLRPGHVLVVPRDEVDHWIDLSPELAAHLIHVSQVIARAIQDEFQPVKVGLTIIGLEVRHVHIHLVPINAIADMTFGNEDKSAAEPAALDAAADKLRQRLSAAGRPEAVSG
jgi:histidine triad (HIT) family protein